MNTCSIALFLFGVLSSTINGIQVAHETCSRAVSIDEGLNNDYCMALCEALSSKDASQLNDSLFTESCTIAHYKTENGRVSSDNACFDNLVYGYIQDTKYDSLVHDLYYATPALCQLACQQNPDCVQWSWASTLVSKPLERQRCLLKSQDMISGALSQEIADAKSEVDTNYCNVGMPELCTSKTFDCLKCDNSKRCAWKSDLYISGWRSCAAEIDHCDGSNSSPIDEDQHKTLYPICLKYVSINPTLTNDYCLDTCNELMNKAGEKELSNNQDFVSNCTKEHYTANGQAKPTGKCFNNLVIGYSETMSSLASMETAQGLYVETPAQCQMHCQHQPDCKSFVFVTELIASTGSHDVHKCLLKSEKMVKEAFNINVADANATLPTQYCNANMPYMCDMGGYDCLSCRDGEKSCAFNSVYHIGGPSHCALSDDICKP